jgi:L-rhamnose mutarotase
MSEQQPQEATPRIRERILGVYRLMQGATTPGEFDAAKHQLDAMLTKYGLALDDFTNVEPPKSWVWFVCNSDQDQKVLGQLLWVVTNNKNAPWKIYKVNSRKRKIGLELTKVQAVDMALLFRTYTKAYKKAYRDMLAEIKRMKKTNFSAFCHANNLFGISDEDRQQEEMTAEKLKELEALLNQAKKMDKTEDPRKPGYLGDGKK